MKTISVKAVKRADFGKKAAKAIRREGMVPCVLCGNGETETFSVDPREIKPLIYTPNSYIVEFDIEGKKEQAVLREAQFHPVREEILHLDFYRIAEGKPVSIAIPVRLTGNAEGVKVGGKLALSARKLVVSALVENLPDEIVVDVTELGVGKTSLILAPVIGSPFVSVIVPVILRGSCGCEERFFFTAVFLFTTICFPFISYTRFVFSNKADNFSVIVFFLDRSTLTT